MSEVAGLDAAIRFYGDEGQPDSFWVSRGPEGSNNGYVAAGGPGDG